MKRSLNKFQNLVFNQFIRNLMMDKHLNVRKCNGAFVRQSVTFGMKIRDLAYGLCG